MFELVASLCLIAAADICRDVLIPGHESVSRSECQDRIGTLSLPDLSAYRHPVEPRCVPAGPTADFVDAGGGVFVHRGQVSDVSPFNFGDVSNIAFVIGDRSIAVIDAGGSRKIGEAVYRAIRQTSDLPISHLVLTHMHPDHVFGASVFADAGARIVGHRKLARALGDRAESYRTSFTNRMGAAALIGTRIVAPDMEVDEAVELDLGGRTLVVRAWPVSHSHTDITAFDGKTGTLFAGDLMFHVHTPAVDGSVRGWRSVLKDLAAIPARRVVPGHGGPILDWPESAEPLMRYLAVLEADTRAAIDQGVSLSKAVGVIGRGEAANWELFDLFNPRNATVAYTELEWE